MAVVALVACGGGGGGGEANGTSGAGELAGAPSSAVANTASGDVASVVATDVPIVNNVVNSSGNFDAVAYRNTAAMMGKEGGIAYRYGPSAAEYGADKLGGIPTHFKNNDTEFLSDRLGGERACIPGNCGTWQVGRLSGSAGGYSSNIGHVAFIPDQASQRVGISNLAISSVSNGVFSQKPELSWTNYEAGLDEINALTYRATGDVSNPVAVGRCYGRPGWCMNPLMVFQSGLIGPAQSNTAKNKATVQLGAGKVPTAIALSNSGEFAFVTVWNTTNLRGEIAVLALAGLCDGCTAGNPSSADWWGEWNALYPGLPNLGNIGYMKLLGYVPLPADMKAPTEIAVTTGVNRGAYLQAGVPGYDSPRGSTPLSNAANRNKFKAGGSAYDSYAKAGVAVVISKSEQRVAFIDLKPLFQYYQKMYFGSDADNRATTDLGNGDAQWPRTFAGASEQMPTVIKTVSLPSRPTAVKAYQWGSNKRAWVATQDGKLRIFNLGDYPSAGNASAGTITEGASVDVGANPTGITFAKEKAGNSIYPDITKEVIVTSRGARKVSWVRFAGDGNSGTVVRTLNDSRLADPIAAEDTDNHSTESYVLSVADYGGRALRNYRYGPVIMHNYGGQRYDTQGGTGFEYGGAFDLPGKAFQITGSNIP